MRAARFARLLALSFRRHLLRSVPDVSFDRLPPHGEAPAARKLRARIPSASRRAGRANACWRAASTARRTRHDVARTRDWRATAHSPCATTSPSSRRMHVRRRRLVRGRQLRERAVAHRAHRVGVLVLELRLGGVEQLRRTVVLAAALDGGTVERVGARAHDRDGVGGGRVGGGGTTSSWHRGRQVGGGGRLEARGRAAKDARLPRLLQGPP